jgi:hypothetical protein
MGRQPENIRFQSAVEKPTMFKNLLRINEGLPGTANDIGHLQRRPVHALCVGSPSPRRRRSTSSRLLVIRT